MKRIFYVLIIFIVILSVNTVYVQANTEIYESKDKQEEKGNVEKANKMYKSCEKNGYTAISMKNDWKTIYGDNVTKK